MNIIRISREFARTDEMKRPDGTSVWFKHGAVIEAEVTPEECERLGDLFTLLNEVVVSEVHTKIGIMRKEFKASMGVKPAPTPSSPAAPIDLSQLPKKL